MECQCFPGQQKKYCELSICDIRNYIFDSMLYLNIGLLSTFAPLYMRDLTEYISGISNTSRKHSTAAKNKARGDKSIPSFHTLFITILKREILGCDACCINLRRKVGVRKTKEPYAYCLPEEQRRKCIFEEKTPTENKNVEWNPLHKGTVMNVPL